MTTRFSRALRRALGLILTVPLLLSGCLWYFYPADQTAELLFHESFDWIDENTWYTNMEPGFTENAVVVNGRLEIYGPGHLLQTQDRFPIDLSILVEWSVTNGDVVSQLLPEPNATYPDFSVTIAEFGLTVELYLYGPGPDSTKLDTIRVVDVSRMDLVDPVSVESAGVTRGRLELRLTPNGEEMGIYASVPETNLEAYALATDINRPDSRITIGVSGLIDDPRSLEEVYIFRRPTNLGGLQ